MKFRIKITDDGSIKDYEWRVDMFQMVSAPVSVYCHITNLIKVS